MKTTIWKAFFDYEKEEKWLNKLSTQGLAMTSYNFCHYTFEDCIPGEYIYRIEFLKNRVNHPESIRYIRFMEENGIEHVDTYHSWVYFRKKAADGNFKIYTDYDSQIKHYQRISNLWLILGCAELCISFSQIHLLIAALDEGFHSWIVNAIIFSIVFSIGALLLGLWWRYAKKIKKLKREHTIQE
jgi:hypothetical protein